MKKIFKILFLICIPCFLLTSCNITFPIDSVKGKKPTNFYYTNLLAKNITLEKEYKVTILETNFYKGIEINRKDKELIKNFVSLLRKQNFKTSVKNLESKPIYKIFFTFKKDKYIINVFNKQYISIHPFDGDFPTDYIDMTNIPEAYNLYNLCNFLFNK
ncbi:DUF4883 family protein [Clostridium sp. Marseille-Q2269]|uniref:DUF4883 family protein n=1 Tax=Clostridium sp. Marseille-Q2269 TaxID=2942205 RepID=UPI0033657FFE